MIELSDQDIAEHVALRSSNPSTTSLLSVTLRNVFQVDMFTMISKKIFELYDHLLI